METNTFRNTAVQTYLAENFIAIRIDADKNRQLARKYRTRGMPVSFFSDPPGGAHQQTAGLYPSDRFLKILKYIGTDSYRRMPLSAFRE
jgi:thioredoxin-related protein